MKQSSNVVTPDLSSPWLMSNKKVKDKIKGTGKGKGKAIPLQAWTGPEGSMSFRLPDFKTVATRRW